MIQAFCGPCVAVFTGCLDSKVAPVTVSLFSPSAQLAGYAQCHLLILPFAEAKPSANQKKRAVLSSQLIETAILACEEHLGSLRHYDIDREVGCPLQMTRSHWEQFLHGYYQVAQ